MQTIKRLLSVLCLLLTVCSLLASAVPAAAADAAVGYATWSVELFTVGCGYLVKPVRMPIYKGETAADGLLRLLSQYGFAAYYGGTPDEAFYLGYIADGTASNARYNGYRKSTTPAAPKKLNLSPNIPSMLDGHLKRTMSFYDPSDYQKHYTGYIGEFVITNGSGWMYSVDHRFPSVGLSDTRLSNGDVVRVQFTLGFGADIGGAKAAAGQLGQTNAQDSTGYYTVANKDELTKAIGDALSKGLTAKAAVKQAYANALSVAETLDASQNTVDAATRALHAALSKAQTAQATASDKTGGKSTQPTEAKDSSKVPASQAPTEAVQTDGLTASVNGAGTTVNGIPEETASHVVPAQASEAARPTVQTRRWIAILCAVLVLLTAAGVGILVRRKYRKKGTNPHA